MVPRGDDLMHACPECGRDCRCTAVLRSECECLCRASTEDDDDAQIEHENVDGFCPDCGAPPDVACSCPCNLCAESGLSYCACDEDDAGYPVPDEFEDDDDDQCDYSEEDLIL